MARSTVTTCVQVMDVIFIDLVTGRLKDTSTRVAELIPTQSYE
jgi:hypothetical protein